MPSMSLMLEGLVTTLLSLDYMHQKEAPLPYKTQLQHPDLQLQSMPSRCRSNSLSSDSSTSIDSESETSSTSSISGRVSSSGAIYQYHCPPCGMMNTNNNCYENNDTVFGSILRGDLPAVTLVESSRLLALEDIKPRAPLHALIIPKAFVGSVFDIDTTPEDVDWMQEMHDMALELVKTNYPEAYANQDYRLCFHIPPFNSVDHLHLHVLAPVSKMGFYYRHIKYNPRTRWCISMEHVMERLQRGESAVPYRRPPSSKPQKESVGLISGETDVCEDPEASPFSSSNSEAAAVDSPTMTVTNATTSS